MKRNALFLSLVLLAGAALAAMPDSVAGFTSRSVAGIDTVAVDSQDSDSLRLQRDKRTATALSDDEGDDGWSLLKGVVPPTPQAAALGRYGDYPVDHSTGVPDISIPVYEIDLGGYRLPVSLSYHASGFRPDAVAPPVGLGWSLRAGGIISRTILGSPDLERYGKYQTYLRDIENFKAEINGDAHETGSGRPIIKWIWEGGVESMWDTEADRYTYNFNGHSGVFRYSHRDGEFIALNHEAMTVSGPVNVDLSDSGEFTICDGAGNSFTFGQPEYTGVANDEGHAYKTSWYLTDIWTPYGTIKFHYHIRYASSYYMKRTSGTYNVGTRFNQDYDRYATAGDATKIYKFSADEKTSVTDYVYKEAKLDSICWRDGKVEFEYAADSPFMDAHSLNGVPVYLERLTEIRVRASDGSVRKTVTLDNDSYWGWNKHNRRMMLRGVTDSELGTYTFRYNDNDNLLPGNSFLSKGTDYWGYYTGREDEPYNAKIASEPKIIALRNLWTQDHRYDNLSDGADRSPDEESMKRGILTSIAFPTGGNVSFEYEANRTANADTSGTALYGGLRIKKISSWDGRGGNHTKRYTYDGGTPYFRPAEWMVYHFYSAETLHDIFYEVFEQAKVVSDPVFPSTGGFGSPLFYHTVREKMDDGTSTTYTYIPAETDPSVRYEKHRADELPPPHVFMASLSDEGNCPALLTSVHKYSASSELLYSEDYEYMDIRVKVFPTGMRLFNAMNFNLEDKGVLRWPVESFMRPPFLYIEQTKAISKSFVNVRKRVKDWTTGVVSETVMSYDEALRTLRPRAVVKACSDGLRDSTHYGFAFDLADSPDAVERELAADYPEAVTSVENFHGKQRVETVKFGYSVPFILPDRLSMAIGDAPLEERERIPDWDYHRPVTAIINETDTVRYEWEGVTYLKSLTAPGGLVTRYTSRPLFGVSSVTDPRGYRTDYSYNPDGRLSGISDPLGTVAGFGYNIWTRDSGAENSVVTSTFLDHAGSRARVTRQYHDGLGRPYLTASLGSNTSGKWTYAMTSYDPLGREAETSLPFVGTSSPQAFTYDRDMPRLVSATYADTAAYSVNHYDGLGRVIAVDTPGTPWREAGKRRTVSYGSNGTDDVRLYKAPLSGTSLVKAGYYAPKTLSSETVTDEDGISLTVFTDLSGRKVLERRGKDNDTYFVYNDLGQLRFVLQPEYQKSGYREKYAFEYRYDSRGNMVKKLLPGCGTVQYWHDRAGRVTFTQDALLKSRGLHRFTLYDRAGRPCVQGTCTASVRSDPVNHVTYSPTEAGIGGSGYVPADPSRISGVTLESVSYYDSHAFTRRWPAVADIPDVSADATGLLTGTMSLTSDGDTVLSAVHYTPRGEVSATVTRQGGDTFTTLNSYTFTGDLSESTLTTSTGISVKTENTFDSASGLPLKTDMTVNGRRMQASGLTYDDLGRVISDARGALTGAVSTAYNLHGAVTSISTKDFTQQLYYNDGPGTPCWNGNVSSTVYSSPTNTRLYGYRFSYNTLGWLSEAAYGEREALSINTNRYTEKILEYTANGAMKRFQRHGLKQDGVYGKIDNLHITLDGNRVRSVTDDALPVTREGAGDFNAEGGAFTYDACGNMTSDSSRGIASIEYDNLNHPVRAQFTDGSLTEWVYSADGTKLRTVHTTATDGVTVPMGSTVELTPDMVLYRDTTDYRGPLVIENEQLARVLFAGGYAEIRESDRVPVYHYYTLDHVGNVRAVTREDGAVVQQTDYYPFGSVIADRGFGRAVQPHKTAGKELDMMHGLGWADFGARRYDPVLPQWTQPDPMAEKYYHISPYSYCGLNPANNIDPDGRIVHPADEDELEMIRNTLPKDIQSSIVLDKNGNIDVNILNSIESDDINFIRLKTLANDNLTTDVILNDEFTYSTQLGVTKIGQLSHYPYEEGVSIEKDIHGDTPSGTSTGEEGNLGKTLFPDKAGYQNSPDSNMKIIVHNSLSKAGAAEIFSHEAYGHGYLYVKSFYNRIKASHEFLYTRDLNKVLIRTILDSKKATIKNMQR